MVTDKKVGKGKGFHSEFLEHLSVRVSDATSGSLVFAAALGIVIIWLLAGPILHFSQAWQLFINSLTTTVTFLMVFLIQRAEKKDAQALHLKLNEIIEKLDGDKTLLDVESGCERRLDNLEEADHQKAENVRNMKRQRKRRHRQ